MGDVNYRILLVEDCKKGMSKIYTDFLYSEFRNLHLNLVTSIADVEHRLKSEDFSAILLAPNLPHYDGTSLVNYIKKIAGNIPLVVSLDSNNAERVEDVRKIAVDKIYFDGVIDIAEVERICVNYNNTREKVTLKPLPASKQAETSMAKAGEETLNSKNQETLQEEIKRHRDALKKARMESESNKEAVLKAKEEAKRLQEEIDTAKKEAAQVKIKVEELKQKNTEQLKELEDSKARVISAISREDKTALDFNVGLQQIIEEKNNLSSLLHNLEGDVTEKDAALMSLNNEAAELKKEIEGLKSSRNELNIRLEDSENKQNVYLRDAQDALANARRAEEQARASAAKAEDSERRLREADKQRDNALEAARLANENAAGAAQEKDAARAGEAGALEAQRKAEAYSVELTRRLEDSEKMADNLSKVVETLETRCEELEAGQAALIEAEHVGIQRERGAREEAEAELRELKIALGELEKIEFERAKLEELLKDGQIRERELIKENTRELEEAIEKGRKDKSALEDELNALKKALEAQEGTLGTLLTKNETFVKELAEKCETVGVLENRIVEYKNTLNELSRQREEAEKKYTASNAALETERLEREAVQGRLGTVEEELVRAKSEVQTLITEKNAVMESYANKTEAVQERLAEAEEMLKDCEWRLEKEESLKELALERVMELGKFEDQVGQLEIELAAKNDDFQSLKDQVHSLKEEIVILKENEEAIKDRVQLETLSNDMKIDTLQGELANMRNEYQALELKARKEKEAVTANAEEIQRVFRDTSEKLKNTQWEAKNLQEKNETLVERVAELEVEVDLLGDLHEEVTMLKDTLLKAERKIVILNDENEKLTEKIADFKAMGEIIGVLEEKAELADQVAGEVEALNKALKEEQIEHRRIAVELRKAQERETHLDELKNSNKELGWELMKARTIIGEYMAREQERKIMGIGAAANEVARLKAELKTKENTISRIISEKEEFTKEQLLKVAELTELYEKAQVERLELLERLGREG